MSLTQGQGELLEAIKSESKADGKAHNLFRIATQILDQDYRVAHRNLQALVRKGMVRVRRGRYLEIEVLSAADGEGLENLQEKRP